jgi:hypothetical protein
MLFKATFNNISDTSWGSVLLVEETKLPGENRRPSTKHWQSLSHNFVSSTLLYERKLLSSFAQHSISKYPIIKKRNNQVSSQDNLFHNLLFFLLHCCPLFVLNIGSPSNSTYTWRDTSLFIFIYWMFSGYLLHNVVMNQTN